MDSMMSGARKAHAKTFPTYRSVELLRDGHERHSPGIEGFDDLGKIGQAASEPIHFINNDDVELAGLNVFEQPFQGWSLHASAGVSAVVVTGWQSAPAFLSLAHDEGLASFPLGVEGIEGLFETFV